MKIATLTLLLALTPGAWAGSYYVCTDASGKKSFQSQPCTGDVKSEQRDYEVSEQPQTSNASNGSGSNDLAETLFRDNKLRKLDRDIKKSVQQLDKHTKSMERELRALRLKKTRANNNMAGAQWETSISEEMNAVTTKYQTILENERSRLQSLRDERNRIASEE